MQSSQWNFSVADHPSSSPHSWKKAATIGCSLTSLLFFLLLGSLAGCKTGDPMVSVDTLRPAPESFASSRVGKGAFTIPAYAKFLKGTKICIDPGHGGDWEKRGFKRGPTGVREAEMNLRTAKYLREFLERAGADVRLTREEDVDLSLKARADVANEWDADIFFSLHHNAIDNKPQTNYTTVWYHGDVDDRPANLDLARHLYQSLADHLALPTVVSIPLLSDLLMYETGFGVLRHANVTAALTESSFYTNPAQEQLLRKPSYNLQEAYALFLGLARYVAAGLPRVTDLKSSNGAGATSGNRTFVAVLDDGLRGRGGWGSDRQMILYDSIAVRINGQLVHFEFEAKARTLQFEIPAAQFSDAGTASVDIQFQNMFKNSVTNPVHTVSASMVTMGPAAAME